MALLDRFEVTSGDYLLTSRWLKAAIGLFRPQIVASLVERDRVIANMSHKDPDGFSEDEDVEVLSSFPFDLASQIYAIEAAFDSEN